MPPSSACSQFDSCQRFDVYVCSGGTCTNSNSGGSGCCAGSPKYVQRMSPTLTSGYDVSLTLRAKLLFSGSDGTSTHWPVTSYFHPWYAQRRPHSSTRPNQSDTPRWAQNSSISPYRPSLSRNAIRRSDRIFTRTGGQSFSGSSSESSAGKQ